MKNEINKNHFRPDATRALESVLPDAGRAGVLQEQAARLSNFVKAVKDPTLIRILEMKIAKIVSQSREQAGWV